jgi:DNA-binding transcriptional MerR regulator
MTREKNQVLSVSQAARELGIAPGTLRTLTDLGRIQCERAHNNDRVFDPKVIPAEKRRRKEKRQLQEEDRGRAEKARTQGPRV